jgi:group I intron endonuclease
VYCLINFTSLNIYVGSSKNIASRMRNYLNNSYLMSIKNKNMPISRGLLKYGQQNFAVLIIEYCNLDVISLQETYWINKLLPYYNGLKKAYSSFGYKHTEVTKNILCKLAKIRKHSNKTKDLISSQLKGEKNPFYGKTHSELTKARISKTNSTSLIYVYSSLHVLIFIFPSVLALAKVLNTNSTTITNYIKTSSLFRGGWYLYRSPLNLENTPLISDLKSKEAKEIILNMKNSAHIKKALFLFNHKKEFLRQYDGIIIASKDLGVHHNLIKKIVDSNLTYNGYLFSYNKLI